MGDTDLERLAAEIAEALRPVLQDVLMGRTKEEVLRDAQAAALRIVQHHLAEANALVLVADLRALLGIPGRVIQWIKDHPYANTDPVPEYWSGP